MKDKSNDKSIAQELEQADCAKNQTDIERGQNKSKVEMPPAHRKVKCLTILIKAREDQEESHQK